MIRLASLCILAVSLVATREARADVLIGDGPLSPYASVQSAIAAAQVGDLVLLTQPVNENLTISYGVAIIADVPGRLTWVGVLRIQDVPLGETVLISGFNFGQALSTPIVLSGNAGSIRFQDCGLLPFGPPPQPPLKGLDCTSSSDVAFLGCGLRGQRGTGSPFNYVSGATAITLTNSNVTFQNSDVGGGDGRDGSFGFQPSDAVPAGRGGNAIVMSGGTLVLQSSTVHGGTGGKGANGSCSGFHPGAGARGGDGLVLTGGAVARAIGGRTLGGVGGLGGVNPCESAANGAHGIDVDAGGGTWAKFEGVSRAFVAPRIVRVGAPLTLSFAGVTGERVFLASSPAAGYLDSAQLHGVLLPLPPFRRLEYGVLDALGGLSVTLTTPALDAGQFDLLHLQPVMLDPNGLFHLGCTRIVVRVAASL